VQRRGVRVTVVSTIGTQPPMIADELRRQADVFIDLRELQPRIGREPPPESRAIKHRSPDDQAKCLGATPTATNAMNRALSPTFISSR
jgi:hypothetical protein